MSRRGDEPNFGNPTGARCPRCTRQRGVLMIGKGLLSCAACLSKLGNPRRPR